MTTTQVFCNGQVFDGEKLHSGKCAIFRGGFFVGLSNTNLAADAQVIDLEGDILSVGYVDLQVNGGDGLLLNDDPSVATLARIARAHRSLGAMRILPTLITDTPEKTRAAVSAAKVAIEEEIPGIAGLHLEGPHISDARKGAHDGAFIRSMAAEDLEFLLEARQSLPALKVTVAPENVTPEQVSQMANAGILVSLGHTDASFETCLAYVDAGARMVTHLFNAMSQLGNRQPGLVGAALGSGALSAGLIADGIHVHPATMRMAIQAKNGPGRIFLVSDAMAVAGTNLDEFRLQGRRIMRRNGRLTLEDGTLAGADLDLTGAIRVLVNDVGVPIDVALQAATSAPARMIGLEATLIDGETQLSDLIRISKYLTNAQPALS